MSSFPNSPRLLKGGIVLIDPDTSAVQRIIALQYNPDTLTRTLQPQAVKESGRPSEALRLTGPPVETIKLEAEIDATDQLEFPDQNQNAAQFGIHPQLAALETIVYPTQRAAYRRTTPWRESGTLEIVPMESPLTLFIWSKNRIVPVRLTDFSITEEAFDTSLNPIRAKVSLGMRVLSVNDLGFDHKGGSLFMAYLQQKEQFAAKSQGGTFGASWVSEEFHERSDASLASDVAAGELKQQLVPANSRYHGIETATLTTAGRPDHRLSAAPFRAAAGEISRCCRNMS